MNLYDQNRKTGLVVKPLVLPGAQVSRARNITVVQ
jgi:hypothetical protein